MCMKHKLYYTTVAIIFSVITVVHLARIADQWEAMIGSYPVPMWVSWAAVIIAGYLALRGFEFANKYSDDK